MTTRNDGTWSPFPAAIRAAISFPARLSLSRWLCSLSRLLCDSSCCLSASAIVPAHCCQISPTLVYRRGAVFDLRLSISFSNNSRFPFLLSLAVPGGLFSCRFSHSRRLYGRKRLYLANSPTNQVFLHQFVHHDRVGWAAQRFILRIAQAREIQTIRVAGIGTGLNLLVQNSVPLHDSTEP